MSAHETPPSFRADALAAASTLLTSTGSFQAVFLATGGVMPDVLLFGGFANEGPERR